MELKNIESFQIKEITESGKFTGYASVFDVRDSYNDIVVKGAFNNSISKRKPKLLWQHDTKEIIGGFTSIKEDEKGLIVEGELDLEITKAREAYVLLKKGRLEGMSIGYYIPEGGSSFDDKKKARILEKIELMEISLVSFPANDKATVMDVKSVVPFQDLPLASMEREWDSDAAVNRIRTETNSEEEPTREYREAFLWYDSENEENFGAYKLPIADVIDGRMVAVPRGIFAAAAALRGARGGVDIPDDDRQRVVANINRYYRKMREDFDDDTIISPFETRSIDECTNLHDVEKFLHSMGLSQKESKTTISKIKEFSPQRDVENERLKSLERDVEELKTIASINKIFEKNINLIKNK